MSSLLIPIAPLTRTKSRLREYFTGEQLKELTIAMFKDLGTMLTKVNFFDHKIIYCNAPEILELSSDYGLIGIKEELTNPPKSFDMVIKDLNDIAINKFHAEQTIFSFLDLILISVENFKEINELIKKNQLVICPAIHSAGISILGRNPPDILETSFSHPLIPSLVAILENASKKGIEKIMIYDSFRAGFDIDIIQDLVLAYQYLKIFNLKHKQVFKFLKENLQFRLKKTSANNNRAFKIVKKI